MKKFEKIIQEVNEEWGDGALIVPELGGSIVNEVPEVISTGSESIDKVLGIGGVPCGRVTEIIGQEASGKTTLVYHIMANAQKLGKRCAFIDAEHAMDRERAEKIGVNFDTLAISQPSSGEEALEILEFLIRSDQFGLTAVDSVASLIPKAELEGEMVDANMGSQARMMGKIMRKITAPTNQNKVCVLFTNQIRQKIGGFGFGPQETTPGGNALKFYATMRLDMRCTGKKKRGEKLLYTTHKLTVKKNKLAPPASIAKFKIGEQGIMDDVVKSEVV